MHFWRFDESFGPSVADMVNDGVDGTLVGTVTRVEHALCETTGCTDRIATNYDAAAGSYDHSCSYDNTGALDFSHAMRPGAGQHWGHVAHVGVPDVQIGDSHLPVADMTVECWCVPLLLFPSCSHVSSDA